MGFGFTVLFAILGPLGREVGFSELQISSIIAASSLVVFLASPRWGRLSDRVGRKKIMIFRPHRLQLREPAICHRLSCNLGGHTDSANGLSVTHADPGYARVRDVSNHARQQRLHGRHY